MHMKKLFSGYSITSGARAEIIMHNNRLLVSAVFSIVDGKQAFYNVWPYIGVFTFAYSV